MKNTQAEITSSFNGIQDVDASLASNSSVYNYYLNQCTESPPFIARNFNPNSSSEASDDNQHHACTKYQNKMSPLPSISVKCEKCQFLCTSLEMFFDHSKSIHKNSETSYSVDEKPDNSALHSNSQEVEETDTTARSNITSGRGDQYSHLMELFQQQEKQKELSEQQRKQTQLHLLGKKISVPVWTPITTVSPDSRLQNDFSSVPPSINNFDLPTDISAVFVTNSQHISPVASLTNVNPKPHDSFFKLNFSPSEVIEQYTYPLSSNVCNISCSTTTPSVQSSHSKVTPLESPKFNRNLHPVTSSKFEKHSSNWRRYETQKAKTYHCSACNKWFTSSGHLKRHFRTTSHQKGIDFSVLPDSAFVHHEENDADNRDQQDLPQKSAMEISLGKNVTSKNAQYVASSPNSGDSNYLENQFSFISPPSTKSFFPFYNQFQHPHSLPAFPHDPQVMYSQPSPSSCPLSNSLSHHSDFQSSHISTNSPKRIHNFFEDSEMNYQPGYHNYQKNQIWHHQQQSNGGATPNCQFNYMQRPLGKDSMNRSSFNDPTNFNSYSLQSVPELKI